MLLSFRRTYTTEEVTLYLACVSGDAAVLNTIASSTAYRMLIQRGLCTANPALKTLRLTNTPDVPRPKHKGNGFDPDA